MTPAINNPWKHAASFNTHKYYVMPTQFVFVCFVCDSEQTAFIFLYSINWLDFITETESVYCEVRSGSLNIIQVNFGL